MNTRFLASSISATFLLYTPAIAGSANRINVQRELNHLAIQSVDPGLNKAAVLVIGTVSRSGNWSEALTKFKNARLAANRLGGEASKQPLPLPNLVEVGDSAAIPQLRDLLGLPLVPAERITVLRSLYASGDTSHSQEIESLLLSDMQQYLPLIDCLKHHPQEACAFARRVLAVENVPSGSGQTIAKSEAARSKSLDILRQFRDPTYPSVVKSLVRQAASMYVVQAIGRDRMVDLIEDVRNQLKKTAGTEEDVLVWRMAMYYALFRCGDKAAGQAAEALGRSVLELPLSTAPDFKDRSSAIRFERGHSRLFCTYLGLLGTPESLRCLAEYAGKQMLQSSRMEVPFFAFALADDRLAAANAVERYHQIAFPYESKVGITPGKRLLAVFSDVPSTKAVLVSMIPDQPIRDGLVELVSRFGWLGMFPTEKHYFDSANG